MIDWGGATVADGTLIVGVTPPPTKTWLRRFRTALALLDRSPGGWDEIRVTRGAITVPSVRAGFEDKLRHLLDSAAIEAGGKLDAGATAGDPVRDAQREWDRRMTEAFRQGEATGSARSAAGKQPPAPDHLAVG